MENDLGFKHSCTFVGADGKKVRGYRWKNPDGSWGGWVAETAKVDPTATVEAGAIVAPMEIVTAGQVVKQH